MKDSDKPLDECINQIKALYNVDPERAFEETNRFTNRLEKIIHSKKPSEVEKRKANWTIVFIAAAILLGGIAIIADRGVYESIGIYSFGFIFFIAGTSVGITQKGALPVLFTHGLTGACLMMWGLLGDVSNVTKLSVILSDLSFNLECYLIIIVIAFVLAFAFGVVCNVNIKYKSNPYSRVIPFVLFAIAFGMAGYLNYIY